MKNIGLLTIAAVTACAAQAEGIKQTTFFGVGNDSCGSFVFALRDDQPMRRVEMAGKQYTPKSGTYIEWAAGAITQQNISVNLENSQIRVDLDGAALWLNNYCEKSPSEPFAFAVAAFVRAHSGN